jgi:AcrR family transcriptional regulator
MRARLIDTALNLAMRLSSGRPSIDDVLKEAGVSRGTYYKYFDSVDDLMRSLVAELAYELVDLLDPLVTQVADPAVRVSCGMRYCLRLAGRHPALGNLLAHAGCPAFDETHRFIAVLRRDIEQGIREGRFSTVSVAVAMYLSAGSLAGGIHAMLAGASKSYPEEAAFCMLRGLGVDAEEAKAIAKMRLTNPKIPHGSMVARVLDAETASAHKRGPQKVSP